MGEKKKKKKKSKGSDDEKKKKKTKDKTEEEDKKEDDMDLKTLTLDGTDDASAMQLAVEGTKQFLVDNPDACPKEILEVVVNQQMASALKSFDKVHIFVRAAITSDFFK